MRGVVASRAAKELIPLRFGVDALAAIRFENVVSVDKVFERAVADPIMEIVDKASGREDGEILGEFFADGERQPFGADAVIDEGEFFGFKAGDPSSVDEFKVACLLPKRRDFGKYLIFSVVHKFLSLPREGCWFIYTGEFQRPVHVKEEVDRDRLCSTARIIK